MLQRFTTAVLLTLLAAGCQSGGGGDAGVRQCVRDGCEDAPVVVRLIGWSDPDSAIIVASGVKRRHMSGAGRKAMRSRRT